MKKAILGATLSVVLWTVFAAAVDSGPASIGFHLSPSVDVVDGRRLWDLSLSLGVSVIVDDSSSVDMLVMVDSQPTSLGLSMRYCHGVTESFAAGFELDMFWAFESEERLVRTLIGSYAHAVLSGQLLSDVRGEFGTSFPLITFAHQPLGWEILPLAELPSIYLAGEWAIHDTAALQGRLTLQPVIVDTTVFEQPIGRIRDDLLVLPMYSMFLRYTP